MDTSKMRKTNVKWLAENDDTGWRGNALRTDLPRAFINASTIGEALYQIASVHDPLPAWTVGADGLYTVFFTDDNADSLALEGDYPVWLDDSDLQPVADWSEDEPDWVQAMGEATPAPAAEDVAAAAAAPSFAFFQPSYEELVLGVIVDHDEDDDDDYLGEEISDDDWDELLAPDETPEDDARLYFHDDASYEWDESLEPDEHQPVNAQASHEGGAVVAEVRTPTEDDLKDWIRGLNLLKAEIIAYDEYDYYCQTSGLDSDERDAYDRQQYNASARKETLNSFIDKAIKALDDIVSLTPESFNDESEVA